MFGIRMQAPFCVLAALLLGACAASPPGGGNDSADAVSGRSEGKVTGQQSVHGADFSDLIEFKVDSALPIMGLNPDGKDALLKSHLSVGVDDDLLRYRASWSMESGDVLLTDDADTASPTRFGGQQFGQNLKLRLPDLAGAPLSLGFTTEMRNDLMVSGYTQSERERANLNWSPGPATVNVEWVGVATAFDPFLALNCDLKSTIKLPTHDKGKKHSEALRLSGRACRVVTGDSRYAGIEAQTWGLGYVWNRPERQSEVLLSVIDPLWAHDVGNRDIEPSYELDLRHRRNFGNWSAKALLSVRQATFRDATALVAPDDSDNVGNTWWAANASLIWHLPEASLSASWAKGIDRLWFMPDVGQSSDRFGLALNLSRWFRTLIPDASPKLAMNWHWSRVYTLEHTAIGNNSLSLNMALMF